MAQLLLDEFRGLNNNQAYELAFNKRYYREQDEVALLLQEFFTKLSQGHS